ncbi:MAG: NAD(P)-dependent oxidoreductase [Bacteroidota bacterium]
MHVSILGLGAMGARMAARLLDHGRAVTVYNRSPERAAPLAERGATVAATPREAAEGSDLVLSIVRDDAAAEAIWLGENGAARGLKPGAVAVESSTVTPGWTRRLAEAVAERDAGFLDAPVVGSRPHAEGGKLTFLIGGEAAALEAARPVLDVLGGAVHHVGLVGSGAAMKLAVNAVFAVQAAVLAEMIAMLRGAGLGEADAVGILNALPTASPAAARLATLMTEHAFAPNFPIDLVEKDLSYAVAEAERSGVEASVVAATQAAFAEAKRRGFGGGDIVGIAQLHSG